MTRALLLLTLAVPQVAAAEMHLSPSGRLQFFPAKDADAIAESLARTGDEDRAAAAREIGRDYDGITEVRIARDPVSFTALQPPERLAPPWASGVAYPDQNVVVLRVGPNEHDPRALLRHELSHIAVGRLTAGRAPRWLLEGLAIIHAGDAWSDEGPSLVQATLADSLFSFDDLTTVFPNGPSDAELAYAQSASFVKYLIDRFGEEKIRDVLRALVAGKDFSHAAVDVLGATPRQLESAWRRSLSRWEMLVRVLTSQELFWGALAALCLLAGGMVLQRRRRRMRVLEQEEQAETMRVLLRAQAVWADRSNDAIEADAAEEHDLSYPDTGDDGEELSEHFVEARDGAPKKPTIH